MEASIRLDAHTDDTYSAGCIMDIMKRRLKKERKKEVRLCYHSGEKTDRF